MLFDRTNRVVAGKVAILALMVFAMSAESATNAVAGDDVARLRTRVSELTEELAIARSEADGLKSRLARYEERADIVELRPTIVRRGLPASLTVLDVNGDLGMIVLPVGAENGIEYGMEFAVMRGNESVASAMVTDVRRSVAGLVVIDNRDRMFPEAGDKCIKIRRSAGKAARQGKR